MGAPQIRIIKQVLRPMGAAMRRTSLGVAAVLAIVMVAPAAAFEFDSTGGSAPGTAASNLADPYADLYENRASDEESETPSGAKTLHGLQLNMSGGGRTSSSVNGGAMGWTNPQPGRLTH